MTSPLLALGPSAELLVRVVPETIFFIFLSSINLSNYSNPQVGRVEPNKISAKGRDTFSDPSEFVV